MRANYPSQMSLDRVRRLLEEERAGNPRLAVMTLQEAKNQHIVQIVWPFAPYRVEEVENMFEPRGGYYHLEFPGNSRINVELPVDTPCLAFAKRK